MPDSDHPALRRAVDVVVPQGRPDFDAVYARTSRPRNLRWTGLGLSVAAAAALVVFLVQPPTTPTFDSQVTAFVALVSAE